MVPWHARPAAVGAEGGLQPCATSAGGTSVRGADKSFADWSTPKVLPGAQPPLAAAAAAAGALGLAGPSRFFFGNAKPDGGGGSFMEGEDARDTPAFGAALEALMGPGWGWRATAKLSDQNDVANLVLVLSPTLYEYAAALGVVRGPGTAFGHVWETYHQMGVDHQKKVVLHIVEAVLSEGNGLSAQYMLTLQDYVRAELSEQDHLGNALPVAALGYSSAMAQCSR
eukprot:COSAG04_NODE_2194_length_4561_cov_3.298073_1_plen_225_part_10